MTTLIEQIEEMRFRVNEFATSEQNLVRALGDQLARVDQTLLHDVRNIAAEHEARRGAILNELQMLAARMCSLHKPREPLATIEGTPPSSRETQMPAARGVDWRNVVANIQDELALKRRASGA